MTILQRLAIVIFIFVIVLGARQQRFSRRRRRFDRGRKLASKQPKRAAGEYTWGSLKIPKSAATQHFLVVGTTGSGKSLVQRMLMKDVFAEFGTGNDSRALVFDAKNDAAAFLKHIQLSVPVYSLHPFDSRHSFPHAVAWDIAADVTCPARALNLAACLLPVEKGGGNRYFTDAARQVVGAVIESLIRHSPRDWTFSDLVYAALSQDRIRQVLRRDPVGHETLDNFLGDERTGYQVFTTIASRMSYFRPVAALWQRVTAKLSLRNWLATDSVLLFGMDATARTALDAINEIMFRILVEEIDMQADSRSRRTWIWIDEARLAGPILRADLLPYLAAKGRSRGACLLLAFQDIEGFREASGPRVANEIIAQCSHKALLRMEAEESAEWASKLLGQYETIQELKSYKGGFFDDGSSSEQFCKREAVLPSEFYLIPPTDVRTGLTGVFVAPTGGAVRGTMSPTSLRTVFIPEEVANRYRLIRRNESDQCLLPWNSVEIRKHGSNPTPTTKPSGKSPALKLRKNASRDRPLTTND